MKKLLIASVVIVAFSTIPLAYLVARSGGGRSSGGGRTYTSGMRSTAPSVIRSSGMRSARVARTGVSRTSSTQSPRGLVAKRGGGRGRGADRRHHGRHGDFWRHRHGFRGYPGNFWSLGIGYPWWWYTYPHICVDEFGFEYPTSFCYAQPSRYFWWYR